MSNTAEPTISANTPSDKSTERLLSLDTYRGLIMCLLAVNGFAIAATVKSMGYGPDHVAENWMQRIWQWLAFHNSHPQWNSQFYFLGCSFWDLIQPSFMFMVGVAMPYSYASRRAKGHGTGRLYWHAFVRAVVLVLLGAFLATRTSGLPSNRLLTNVLAQIGLGYFFVFLLLGRTTRVQIAAGIMVLIGYSAFLNLFPVMENQPKTSLESIESLWVPKRVALQHAIHTNGAARADVPILGLERGEKPLQVHKAGYATLNFIPAAVTILIGVLAGTVLRSQRDSYDKLLRLIVGGVVCMTLALLASLTVSPVIKKIWTPGWTLFSAAYTLWILATLYWLIDVKGVRRWTFPLVIVGMNSLAMYLMGMLMKGWVVSCYKAYLGKDIFAGPYSPTIQALAIFVVFWLICLYLYRARLFLRI